MGNWKIDHDGREYSGYGKLEAEQINKSMFKSEGVVSEMGSQSKGCAVPFFFLIVPALMGAAALIAHAVI
jgi:hypothetical protein